LISISKRGDFVMTMTEQYIEQAIKDHIVKEFLLDDPEREFNSDTPLILDGIIDSLGIFDLISFIEQQLSVKLQPDDVIPENFESVNAIKSLVIARLS
jgi:acyl carrier protein